MRTLDATMLAMLLATGAMATHSTAAAEEKEVETTDCKPQADGSTACFDYCLLPSDKNTVSTTPMADTSVCSNPHKLKLVQQASSPREMLKLVSEACSSEGGVVHQAGSLVACVRTQAPAPARATAQPLVIEVTRPLAAEIASLLQRQSFSRDTASVLVRIAASDATLTRQGYHQSGGWCWNDDWTFHGSLPCPKTLRVAEDGRKMEKR